METTSDGKIFYVLPILQFSILLVLPQPLFTYYNFLHLHQPGISEYRLPRFDPDKHLSGSQPLRAAIDKENSPGDFTTYQQPDCFQICSGSRSIALDSSPVRFHPSKEID